jgi:hypothetical protein
MLGSVLSISVGILVFQSISAIVVGRTDQLRAQIVADAAALVAIHEGEDAARALANANGAELIRVDWLNEFHTYVEVRVRVDNRESISTAVLT